MPTSLRATSTRAALRSLLIPLLALGCTSSSGKSSASGTSGTNSSSGHTSATNTGSTTAGTHGASTTTNTSGTSGTSSGPTSNTTGHTTTTNAATSNTTSATTGTSATSSGPTTGTSGTNGSSGSTCLSATLLGSLGKNHPLAGASMSDATAASAPFDLRYQYISGGLFSGSSPCASCATGCTDGAGNLCDNQHGCGWWGCWQYDQDPPGEYATEFITTASGDHEIPMFTYYEVLQASGASEGAGEVAATNDATFMTRYLADWRFLLQKIGNNVAFLHIEPDFWGYAEQANSDPHQTPSAVNTANPTDCGSYENSIAGLGQCMIHMVRVYAPNAKVGLHGSGWGTNVDVLLNSDPNLDVAGEAAKLGNFLKACGGDQADFVVIDASDRDAGYYQSQGRNTWWDATNATLPNFNQAFTWAQALSETLGLPHVWWQVPVGNMSLNNTSQHYQDNRVDYFFSHTDQLARAHGAAMAFGAGDGNQTTPDTDNGHLAGLVTTYEQQGQPICP